MRALRWSSVLLVLAPVAVLGERSPAPPPRDPGAELAHDLSMLATGAPATAADRAALAAAGHAPAAYARYIDELVRRPGVAAVAPSVLRIHGSPARTGLAQTVLRQHQAGADVVYYVHAPCDPKQAEAVRPWWDLDRKVLVCPEAHRPEVFRAPDGNYCSGVYAAAHQPGSPCGCGPNLIRCVRSEQEKADFARAIVAEASGTVAWVVGQDLPLEALFSSPESHRPPLAELLYQRWKVENRDVPSLEALPDWRRWPKEGAWAVRPASRPGQHAGIFTNHFTPQSADSQRLKLSGFFDMLWCEDPDSLRVQTAAVLEVAEQVGGNLRSKVGWEELAARPVCTSCHARVDHGVQFFSSIHWYYQAMHYVAEAQQDIPGALYLRDIDDERGRAPRNPQGFIRLALAQPEFARCMSRDFLEHAFGGAGEPELRGLDDTLRGIVERKGTYRDLLKATLEHYKERALRSSRATISSPSSPSSPSPPSSPAAPPDARASAAAIADLVDDRCGSCHDAGDGEPPGAILAHGAAWCARAGRDCARLGVEILSAVAFDRMPKERPLAAADKRRLFELLAPIAWPDGRAREMARRYFLDAPQAPPVHRLDAMLGWIRASASPAHPVPPIDLPPAASGPRFSTTAAAQAAVAAAKVCAADPDREACLRRAMDRPALEK